MQNIFSTKDFYCSAFIICSGHRLIGQTRVGPITIFEFNKTDELKKLVDAYYSQTARVSPMSFGSSIRNLKSLLHNSSESNTNQDNNDGNNKSKATK